MDFFLAGTAAVGAGFFTNPLEVLKTRMQLQGELNAKGNFKVVYRNTPHAVFTIVKHDGVLSLQKGLAPALIVQFLLNGVRLGFYEFAENRGLTRNAEGHQIFLKTVLVGGCGAVAGHMLANPFFLIKTQLQTQSVDTIAVGYQHQHQRMWSGLKSITGEQGRSINRFSSKRNHLVWTHACNSVMDFLLAGAAACGACVFTNPLEVLKTRMQLQGELSAKGQHVVHYKNVVHAAYVVAKNDGVMALQKGMVPAMWVQLIMNGLRLGTFQFGESHGYVTDTEGNLVFYKSVLVGGAGGVAGQYLSSPFYLVKTQRQSQAAKAIAVGHQHQIQSTTAALKNMYRTNGIRGLYRGAGAAIPRAFIGSVAQLTSFKYTKEYLLQFEYFTSKPLLTSFCGSMVGGVAISLMMTPFDLIMTRLYNQPVDANGRGLIYGNYLDCVVKIFKSEGIYAFYKGVGPMYLRLGPHSVLCLMFWDKLNALYKNYKQNNE